MDILQVQKLNDGVIQLKCPQCGAESFETTCVAYFPNDLEHDGNRLRCKCGWTGIARELYAKIKQWVLEQYGAVTSVSRIEQAVINLIVCKARDRKTKLTFAEMTWGPLFTAMDIQTGKLIDLTSKSHLKGNCLVLDELAEMYGLLVHATIKAGFSMDQVEQRELAKLKERFEYDDTVLQHRKADHVSIEPSSTAPSASEKNKWPKADFDPIVPVGIPPIGAPFPGSTESPQEKPEPGKDSCR